MKEAGSLTGNAPPGRSGKRVLRRAWHAWRARFMATPAAPPDLHDRQAELREQERRREAVWFPS